MNNNRTNIINSTIDIVEKEQQSLQYVLSKDLIIIIGEAQTGKSTLINSVFGVRFIEDEDNEVLIPIDPIIAPVGNVEMKGASCTEIPAIYISQNLYISFLDTQGFFDSRNDHIKNMASELLLEIAIKRARSVRIVSLISYDKFKLGLVEFGKIGKIICRMIKQDDAPIYFVFNRFTPPPKLIKKNFYNWSEYDKNQEIKKLLKMHCDNIIKAGNLQYKKELKRIYNRIRNNNDDGNDDTLNNDEINNIYSNMNEFMNDDEYQKNEQINLFLSILKNNFSKNYYGYIDPTSQESIKNFINDISNVEKINISNFVFDGLSDERVKFNSMFEDNILQENKFLKKVIFATHYPTEIYDNLICQLNRKLDFNRNRLNQIDRNEFSDEMLMEFNEEICQVRQNLVQQMNSYQEQMLNVQNEKTRFENSRPVEFWNDHWDHSPGLYWWRNHLCKYDLEKEYCEIKEELEKGTIRVKIISNTSPKFEVMYSSSSTTGKIVKSVVGAVLFPISAPILSMSSDKCKGKVTLFAYPKVLEPNVIPRLNSQIDIFEREISYVSNQLSNLNSNVRNQIINVIQIIEGQLQALIRFKSLSQNVTLIWNNDVPGRDQKRTKKNEISRYKNVIQYLYNINTQKYSINEFNNLFNIAFTAHSLINTPITVENLLSDAYQVFD